jgi:ABC-type sugar transport system permease subunit
MLLPATVRLIVFTFAPLGYAFWISFQNYQLLSGQLTWIGAANYVRLLSDPGVLQSLIVSGLYTVVSVAAQVVLGLGLAVLAKDRVRGLGFFRTAYFLPVVPLAQHGPDAELGPLPGRRPVPDQRRLRVYDRCVSTEPAA